MVICIVCIVLDITEIILFEGTNCNRSHTWSSSARKLSFGLSFSWSRSSIRLRIRPCRARAMILRSCFWMDLSRLSCFCKSTTLILFSEVDRRLASAKNLQGLTRRLISLSQDLIHSNPHLRQCDLPPPPRRQKTSARHLISRPRALRSLLQWPI